MEENDADGLFEFAELVLAIGRLIRPLNDHSSDMCTPVESSVMRFIEKNPGASAGEVSDATLLPPSNFSRVLRGLEKKRLVRREVDVSDARRIHLFPTAHARQNLQELRDAWTGALAGIIDEPGKIASVNATMQHIENELIARRRR